MAFPLPEGLVAQPYGQVAGDDAIEAIEGAQPGGTRMLVALGFGFRWPGFGWSADMADAAARGIGGLRPWPELSRVVIPDPDGEPVWWVCYLSSPAWWVALALVLAAVIAVAVTVRIVWTVVPQEARSGLGVTLNILPLMVLGMLAMMLPPLLREMAPGSAEPVRRKLRGGTASKAKGVSE
jgi:hypothetical protein